MFTFGREHEKKCEAHYVRNPSQIPLLLSVVDAVHDLIEGKGTEEDLKESLRKAFVEGGAGVWENTEKWLRKSSVDYPGVLELWSEFANHPKAEVRFRVACVLNRLPMPLFLILSSQLVNDKSKKVHNMARERVQEVNEQNAT
jgi:hypothetical protein